MARHVGAPEYQGSKQNDGQDDDRVHHHRIRRGALKTNGLPVRCRRLEQPQRVQARPVSVQARPGEDVIEAAGATPGIGTDLCPDGGGDTSDCADRLEQLDQAVIFYSTPMRRRWPAVSVRVMVGESEFRNEMQHVRGRGCCAAG
jgi:hypothetical protein